MRPATHRRPRPPPQNCARHPAPAVMPAASTSRPRPARGRSRTPPRAPADHRCSICWNELGDTRRWTCAMCGEQVHDECMQRAAAVRGTRADGGGSRACPVCRTGYEDLVRHLLAPMQAPDGAVCWICREDIPKGHWMVRCGNRASVCAAMWHVSCEAAALVPPAPVVRGCRACGCRLSDCIANRRRLR